MIEFPAAIMGGFLGSAHCVGMCGGIALTVGGRPVHLSRTVARQLLFSAGRLCTYMFLGAMVGFAGRRLTMSGVPFLALQRGFALLGGGLMVLVGLSLLGWRPWRRREQSGGACGGADVLRDAVHAPGIAGPFIAGLATGFLPCGLVYAYLASALATAEPGRAMLIMGCFGLGTLPAMLLTGCGGAMLHSVTRGRVFRLAACVVMGTGLITVWRGWPRAEGELCHTPPAPSAFLAPTVLER